MLFLHQYRKLFCERLLIFSASCRVVGSLEIEYDHLLVTVYPEEGQFVSCIMSSMFDGSALVKGSGLGLEFQLCF